ncbi:hypothetical protein GF323_02990 [Candidatus Woesearchaeota archaeon]|nr:hypothetical protein [Candidatus Woesearchaeota archaeon]
MIKLFSQITKEDIEIAGGKAANLGELTKAGFNVPSGFVITTKAYKTFIELKELEADISEQIKQIDIDDHEKVEIFSKELKKIITDEEIFEELIEEINQALNKLKGNKFAVRSSATAEDMITASFAGQQDTYLNVEKKDIIKQIQNCWASLFNPRAIYYRHEKKIPHDVSMAVMVQEMVDADSAGVMFTVDPVRKKYILVEAAHGLGEQVVSGSITPSSYMLDKETLEIAEKSINFEIDEDIIKEIAKTGKKIESHYKKPQDIEFAVKEKKIYILQSRPITTL